MNEHEADPVEVVLLQHKMMLSIDENDEGLLEIQICPLTYDAEYQLYLPFIGATDATWIDPKTFRFVSPKINK